MDMFVIYICLALLSIGLVIIAMQWRKINVLLAELNTKQSEVKKLKDELAESNQRRDKMRNGIREYAELKKEARNIDETKEDEVIFAATVDLMKQLFDSQIQIRIDRILNQAIESKRIIRLLQREVTQPFRSKLWNQDTPVPDAQCEENVAALIDMAMKTYDIIESFENPNFEEKQKLNIQLVEQTITRAEALEKAIPITDISDETPRWARVLKASIVHLNLKDRGIIFSGYKL